MPRSLVVVGGGAAGVAAAWRAARLGADVSLFFARAGASALSCGALDGEREAALEPDVASFVEALGGYRLCECWLATRQGVVRASQGHDLALLDLTPLAGQRVGVADLERDDWDAPGIAATLSASAWARRTRTEFIAVPVPGCRTGPERRIAAYDFALLHDHPERSAWFAGLLRERRASLDAWLVGPWLGTDASVAARLRQALGMRVGEATSPPAGPAGSRFEAAAARLLRESGVIGSRSRVSRVERVGRRFRVSGEHGELTADAVILATGGVAAGGIELEHDAERGRGGFRLALGAPVRLRAGAEVLGQASSLFWPSFEHSGFGVLEELGLDASESGLLYGEEGEPQPDFCAAGDCLAGRPRSLLEAVRTGCVAARTLLSASVRAAALV